MNRWSTWAFGLLALSCCPQPEGCLESPGTLRYLLEAHYHGLIIQWALHGKGSLGQHLDRGMGRLLDSLGL